MKAAPHLLVLAALLAVPDRALAETKHFDLPPFTFVSVSAGITAIVTIGPSQSVTAEAPSQGILSRLAIGVDAERLNIGMNWDMLDFVFNFAQRPGIVVRVTTPEIVGIDASSGANVDAKGMAGDHLSLDASSGAALAVPDFSGGVLNASASSGATIEVTGTCTDLNADGSSGGHVRAQNLKCDRLDATGSTGGSVIAYVTKSAQVRGSVGGSVTVLGNPETLDQQASTGGWVKVGE